jgi:hypothetical protein
MLIKQNRLRQPEHAIKQRPIAAGFGKKPVVKKEPRPHGQFRELVSNFY